VVRQNKHCDICGFALNQSDSMVIVGNGTIKRIQHKLSGLRYYHGYCYEARMERLKHD
jgi:hypothetical protein